MKMTYRSKLAMMFAFTLTWCLMSCNNTMKINMLP